MTLTLVANRRHRPPARAADGGVVVLPLLAEEGWQRGAHTYAAPTPACIGAPARRNLPRPHTHTSARNIALSLPLTLTRPSPSANPRPSRRPTATGVPRRRRRPSRRQRWSEPCCDLTLLLFYTDGLCTFVARRTASAHGVWGSVRILRKSRLESLGRGRLRRHDTDASVLAGRVSYLDRSVSRERESDGSIRLHVRHDVDLRKGGPRRVRTSPWTRWGARP